MPECLLQRAESELRMLSFMITVSLLTVGLSPLTRSTAYHCVVFIQINVDPGVIGYNLYYNLCCLCFHRCYTYIHNLQANGVPLNTDKIRKPLVRAWKLLYLTFKAVSLIGL